MYSEALFGQVAKRLLKGAFICEWTDPDGYEHIQDPLSLAEMSAYLGRMSQSVSRIGTHGPFFATASGDDPAIRANARRVMAQMRTDIGPIVHFLRMTMEALRDDQSIAPGYVFSKSLYAAAVGDSPALVESLRSLVSSIRGTPGKDTIDTSMDKILGKMKDWGYIDLVDREKGIWRVTGKIDYAHAIIAYLTERLPTQSEEETLTKRQDSLL